MSHQSRLVILPAFSDTIIDLNDIVMAKKTYYPGHEGLQITLRSCPMQPITIGNPHMEEAWNVLKQHLAAPREKLNGKAGP